MNIVILGAGTVGTSIAEMLYADRQNISLVDASRASLSEVEETLDVQTVVGSACDAIALFQAGVQSADLCLAVTSQDEVNLVGASLAKAMGAARSVARIFNERYLDFSTFDYRRHFGIDRLLSLERLTALELAKHIRTPGLFALENFARGGVEVQEVAAEPDSKGVGVPLRELKLPREVRVGLISDGDRAVIAGAEDIIHAGDHVTLIGMRDQMDKVKRMFERKSPPWLRVVIGGGGEIGYNLAQLLERGRFQVLLLETNGARCQYLAQKLEETTILHADATRRSEMEEARLGKADVFVAAMGHDEDNIVAGVEARALGCPRILSIVRRPDYANVLHRLGIDVAVSPREAMARQILGMVDAGPIVGRSEIAGGDAQVWEVEVTEGMPITQAPLKNITLHQGLVAAIVREDYVRVPGADDVVQPGDTVVLLVQKESMDRAMALFQPPRVGR